MDVEFLALWENPLEYIPRVILCLSRVYGDWELLLDGDLRLPLEYPLLHVNRRKGVVIIETDLAKCADLRMLQQLQELRLVLLVVVGGTVRVLMDDSANGVGVLERALPRMEQEGYRFRLLVETDF